MKKMVKCLVLAMAVVAIAGSAWSWDFANHIKMAPNGQGDMLLYPFFAAANGGWETRVSVVNTSPNRSVVAHIVFYTAKSSIELTDFFLFLTPTDVWYGIVKMGTDGKAYIWSDDDSALNDAGTFSTSTAPLNHVFMDPLRAGTCTQGNPEPWSKNGVVHIGYMKIIELAHSSSAVTAFLPGGTYGTQTFNLNAAKTDKNVLKIAFDRFLSLQTGIGVNNTNPLVMDGINVIKGSMEFRNPTLGQGAIIPATALRDYDNQLPVGYTQSIGFAAGCGYAGGFGVTGAAPSLPALGASGRAGCQVGGGANYTGVGVNGAAVAGPVICNPSLLPGGKATTFGANCGCLPGGFGCESNSVGEVEAALAKEWLEMPILTKAGTLHILTFPTKQTGTGSAAGVTDCYFVNSPSPFFNENDGRTTMPPVPRPAAYSSSWETWGCVQYLSSDYDLSENASTTSGIFSPSAIQQALCAEVNLRGGDFAFENGWAVYNFTSVGAGTNTVGNSTYSTRFNMQANLGPAAVAGVCGGVGLPPCFDARYTGAPVIATALYMGADGLKLAPSSWVDGEVRSLGANGVIDTTVASNDDVVYNYYQYWDFANTNGMSVSSAVNSNVHISEDATGCCVAGSPAVVVACGTAGAVNVPCGITLANGGGVGTIYQNKFSGNRPGVLSNAMTTLNKAMTVLIPGGTTVQLWNNNTAAALAAPTFVAYAALPAGLMGGLAAAAAGPPVAPTTTGAVTLAASPGGDSLVTLPAGTTIMSSANLTSSDSNIPSNATNGPQPSQMPW